MVIGIVDKLHSWVQGILTSVQVCSYGSLNKILLRVSFGLGYIRAPVLSDPHGGKPG